MKILQINNVYKAGSTGKIISDINSELNERSFSTVICYGRGEKTSDEHVYRIVGDFYGKIQALISRITGVMYGGCFFSTSKLISIIKKEKPDIVHLHCINGHFVNIYKLISWLKNNNIKTVLSLHAEFMHTANCGYALECEKWKNGCGKCPRLKEETKTWFFDSTAYSWQKMKQAFDGFNDNLVVTSVSSWLMERAKQSPILADKKHFVVLNGLDTSVFHMYNSINLKEKMGISPECKVIFHATPEFNLSPNHIKGGYYVIKLAETLLNKNIKIVVAGNYDASYNYPTNMIMLGSIKDQQRLAEYYSMADVTILTSKKETFSMVTAESLCCGTPVVGFKSGAPEQIAIPDYSEFVEYSDVKALGDSVLRMLNKPIDSNLVSSNSIDRYSKETMVNNYINVYNMFV